MAEAIYPDRTGARNANYRGGFASSCAECSTQVWVKPSRAHRSAHYCSQPCANAGKSKRFAAQNCSSWSGGGVQRRCRRCEAPFSVSKSEAKRGGGIFCSRDCTATHKLVQHTVVCEYCRAPFSVASDKRKSARFCSRACKNESQRVLKTPEAAAKLRLDRRISAAVGITLKKGQKAGRSWRALVPFTAEQLKQRLLDTIPTGYTWDDFLAGRLEIDHIVPRSAFNYVTPDDLDFKRCWALSNLQLLSAFDNNSKGAKLSAPFQPALLLAAP